MDSPQQERNVLQFALDNPIILTAILKQNPAPLKEARLVSHLWNETVLSLPYPRLALKMNYEPIPNAPEDDRNFKKFFTSIDDRLAKRVNAIYIFHVRLFGWDAGFDDLQLIYLCNNYGDKIQIFEAIIDHEMGLKSFYKIAKRGRPNLQQLRITCTFPPNPASCPEHEYFMRNGLPSKPNLTLFTLSSKAMTYMLTRFVQVFVDAAPNLKVATIPLGFYPNFANSKFLTSLTIAIDGVDQSYFDDPAYKPVELCRMLDQVRDQLVTLNFCSVENILGLKNIDETSDFDNLVPTIGIQLPGSMPKLVKFRNEMVEVFRCDDFLMNADTPKTLLIGKGFKWSGRLEEILENVVHSRKVLSSVRNLEITELHDLQLFGGLVTAFPNLERLKVESFYCTDFKGEESEMELGVVLKTCKGWKGLKHLDLALPTYPIEILEIIKALLEVGELYKRLRTLQIETYNGNFLRHDLTLEELDLFKQLLLAMDGMDEVKITNLILSKKSVENLVAFIEANAMSLYKFNLLRTD
ncbi:uncharacterized protein LOC118436903 [Folsomia candida]|uniref:uncharacterized protein LOC118436903 n=1 Tax=Folsomia candida TaxID=158441 RepID=UPI001604CC00|nr:uncharacterized protein LOC118436903 [Folsomia candida]